MSTRHRLTNSTTPVLPQAIHEAIEEEARVLDRLYGRIPPGSRMSDCVEAFERIAILAYSQNGLINTLMERWRMSSTGLDPHRDGEWVLFAHVAGIIAQRDDLLAALMHFGTHKRGCASKWRAETGSSQIGPCDCGLDAMFLWAEGQ